MTVLQFAPDGTEASLWQVVKAGLDESQPEDRLVIVSSYEEPEANEFKASCDRLLTEFPGLLVVAINLHARSISTLRNEVRDDQIPSSLRMLFSAIRNMKPPTQT